MQWDMMYTNCWWWHHWSTWATLSYSCQGNRWFPPFCSGHRLDVRRTMVWGRFSVLLSRCVLVWNVMNGRPSTALFNVHNLPSFLEVYLLCPFYQVCVRCDFVWPWDSSISHNAFHLAQNACTSSYADPDVLQTFRSPLPCTVLLAHVLRTCQPLVQQNFVGFTESILGPAQKIQ